jgi:hypothetical protein
VSNLSTYVAGALAAIVVMDHAATIAPLRPSLELPTVAPDDVIEPAATVRPANAPLEVVDEWLTGSTRGAPSSLQDNVTAVVKRAAPPRDPQPLKQALPPGCESAFGRLAAPPLAHVPGRCIS